MAIDEDAFKRCMGRWPSGVTIVTTRSGAQIHGMTVSDFSGASLSPPLVTICCNRDSMTTRLIAEGRCFAVNVLAAGQQELANRFASKELEHVRFEGLEFSEGRTGAPLIPGALVNIDCSLAGSHEAGDHVIYVGQAELAQLHDRDPLLYYAGGYRRLADPEDAE